MKEILAMSTALFLYAACGASDAAPIENARGIAVEAKPAEASFDRNDYSTIPPEKIDGIIEEDIRAALTNDDAKLYRKLSAYLREKRRIWGDDNLLYRAIEARSKTLVPIVIGDFPHYTLKELDTPYPITDSVFEADDAEYLAYLFKEGMKPNEHMGKKPGTSSVSSLSDWDTIFQYGATKILAMYLGMDDLIKLFFKYSLRSGVSPSEGARMYKGASQFLEAFAGASPEIQLTLVSRLPSGFGVNDAKFLLRQVSPGSADIAFEEMETLLDMAEDEGVRAALVKRGAKSMEEIIDGDASLSANLYAIEINGHGSVGFKDEDISLKRRSADLLLRKLTGAGLPAAF